MGFSAKVKQEALVFCGRHCCICHKFCGTKIETHHIQAQADGGENTFENAIPLCFNCHADMKSYDHKHPKGTKYTYDELKRHRDNWYKKINDNIGLVRKEEAIETDKNIYKILTEILPWNSSIQFLRTNHFAGSSFQRSEFDDIHNFLYKCSNPAFEFLDPDLEGIRIELIIHCNDLAELIAIETFPTHNVGWRSVPEEWAYEQPERFDKAVKAIHNAADLTCQTYDTIIRTATRKLGILPDEMQA